MLSFGIDEQLQQGCGAGLLPQLVMSGGATQAELGFALLLAQRGHRIYAARATCG